MERGGEVDDVRAGIAGFEQHAVKPLTARGALGGGCDVKIVLQVVADDQRRPVFAPAATAQLLARAVGLDNRPVYELDGAGAPGRAAACGEWIMRASCGLCSSSVRMCCKCVRAWPRVADTIQM